MMSIDQHKAVVLVLLDLSAAFDTVDHSVLFTQLKVMFGLTGNVLIFSAVYPGSLGLYCSLTSHVFAMRSATRLSSWTLNIYIVYKATRDHSTTILSWLSLLWWWRTAICITRPRQWIKLYLFIRELRRLDCLYSALDESNSSIWLHLNIKRLVTPELHVGETCITSSDSVKNLGIIFDKCVNMTDHVSSVCRAS